MAGQLGGPSALRSKKQKMLYRILADLVLVVHLAFLVFAVLGGFLVFRWKRCAWIHIPAMLWAALIEFADWVCPLTPLENWLLQQSGGIGYPSDFIEHYIVPVVYPTVLTRHLQIALGLIVLGVNLGIYGWVICRTTRSKT